MRYIVESCTHTLTQHHIHENAIWYDLDRVWQVVLIRRLTSRTNNNNSETRWCCDVVTQRHPKQMNHTIVAVISPFSLISLMISSSFLFWLCSAFATSLWDLQRHFNDNKAAHNGLGKIVHCFQEMNKYQTILLDQANRTILKNITSFLKTDIKEVKEYKNIFVKASESYDSALTRNAQANKNRPQEVLEAANILSAASSGFRHTALDYVNLLTLLQSKKMPEILSTVSVAIWNRYI